MPSDTDTAARSLEHWSEHGRAEMEAFYALATEDYRQPATAADWPELLCGRPTPPALARGEPARLDRDGTLGQRRDMRNCRGM